MRLRQGLRWIPMLLLVGMLVTACGSQSAAATPTDTVAAAPTATSGSQPTTAATGNKTVVQVSNFKFTPATITVKAGTTVEWQGQSGTHEVKNDPGSSLTFDGPLDTGAKFDVVFSAPGTYHYHCQIHPSMVAEVIVTA
jgi:plastocyanin